MTELTYIATPGQTLSAPQTPGVGNIYNLTGALPAGLAGAAADATGSTIRTHGGQINLGGALTGAVINVENCMMGTYGVTYGATNINIKNGGVDIYSVQQSNVNLLTINLDNSTGGNFVNFYGQPGGTVTINGFGTGDIIAVNGYTITGYTYNSASGILSVGAGGQTYSAQIGSGRTDISSNPNIQIVNGNLEFTCFLTGTRLATPLGPRAVEELRIGDELLVRDKQTGDRRPEKISWIGYRKVSVAETALDRDAFPVRIRANAFEDGKPERDLLLTNEHSVFVEGGLVPIRMLVNHASILVDREIAAYTYYHVELERHSIIFAEELETESYLDTGNRSVFANADAEVLDFATGLTLDAGRKNWGRKNWESDAAAPLTVGAETVGPIWRGLDARTQALGHARTVPATTNDPGLRLEIDGEALEPLFSMPGRHVFRLPGGAGQGPRRARLRSRSARPADVSPWIDDRRDFGLYVHRIVTYSAAGREEAVALDGDDLAEGWRETIDRLGDESMAARWTTGDAFFAIPASAQTLEIDYDPNAIAYLDDEALQAERARRGGALVFRAPLVVSDEAEPVRLAG